MKCQVNTIFFQLHLQFLPLCDQTMTETSKGSNVKEKHSAQTYKSWILHHKNSLSEVSPTTTTSNKMHYCPFLYGLSIPTTMKMKNIYNKTDILLQTCSRIHFKARKNVCSIVSKVELESSKGGLNKLYIKKQF